MFLSVSSLLRTALCIRDLRRPINDPELHRIISLASNRKQLAAKRHPLTLTLK